MLEIIVLICQLFNIGNNVKPCQWEGCLHVGAAGLAFQIPRN